MNKFKNFPAHHPMTPTMNRTVIFSLLLILLSAWPVWGATYYVKAGGNDSLDGLSDGNAWATVAKATSGAVVSGDTVYFRSQDTWQSSGNPTVLTATAGVTYDGSTYGTGTRAKFLATARYSTPYRSVVRINVSNVTFRGFEINGGQVWCFGIDVGYDAADDINNTTIDNCVVHDNGNPADVQWCYGIHVGTGSSNKTVSNTTIVNTTVYNTGQEGIAIYPNWGAYNSRIDTVLIRNCRIYDTGKMGAGSGSGVSINNDSDNVTVEYCYLNNNSRDGIDIRVSPPGEGPMNVLSAPNNMVIRYNIISNNLWFGVSIWSTRNYVMSGDFYGNIFYENGPTNAYNTGADFLISSSTDYHFSGSTFNIYNNTFYSTSNANTNMKGVVIIGKFSGTLSDLTVNFKNNIIYAGDYYPIWDLEGRLTHSNNLIYRSSGADLAVYTQEYASTGSPETVTVSSDATATYFTKPAEDETDWTATFHTGDCVMWTGFAEPLLNGRFEVWAVTADQIKVNRVGKNYYPAVTATGVINPGGVSLPSASVVVFNYYSTYTYFWKEDSTDWKKYAKVGDTVTWTGFANSVYNGTAFKIIAVDEDYIAVALIANELPEAGVTATPQRWKATTYNRAATTKWEATAQNTNPTFTGGTLPTGFSGIYGTDMIPNTPYFSVASGSALNNGATLGSPYNGCINGAGLATPITRPQGAAYDIGAYEYVESVNPETAPAAPTGLRLQ